MRYLLFGLSCLCLVGLSGCVTSGGQGPTSNTVDAGAGSLGDRRAASRTIALLSDDTSGYTRMSAISARRCHRNAFATEPDEEALTQDLKNAAYAAGGDAISIRSFDKVNGLLANCWYVLEGKADVYRKN